VQKRSNPLKNKDLLEIKEKKHKKLGKTLVLS
jgi:hypothetical protein